MKCAIMQPTYLPWSGYFNLMSMVDIFIFLDDVQFERRSWQVRNQILMQGRTHILTVPTQKAPQDTAIADILVHKEANWQSAHWQTLVQAYGKSAGARDLLSVIQPIYNSQSHDKLRDLNISLVRALAKSLGIRTKTAVASDLGCGGRRGDHLIEICRALNCREYLSPIGSKAYLEEDKFETRSGLHLEFQNYTPEAYRQPQATSFVSHLSVVDVIANEGLEFSRRYIDG